MRLLSFTIDDQRYGVSSDAVVEIVRAVAITPLPGAPAVVEGIIDVRGAIAAVFDLRARFGRPAQPLDPGQRFIVVRTASRLAALHVDHVLDLMDVDDRSASDLKQQVPGARHISGVAALPD